MSSSPETLQVKPKVIVCQPIYGWVPAEAALSFATLLTCGSQKGLIGGIALNFHGVLSEARNHLVEEADKYRPTHILFVDSDMVLPHYALERLLARQKPVVSAMYFERTPPHRPVFRTDRTNALERPSKLPTGLQEVQFIGMGCALIQMDVLYRIAAKQGCPPKPARFFAFENNEGEDFFFCRLCHELDIPIFVDADVECGHVGTTIIGSQHFQPATARPPLIS
jgi:hypothetical protein